MCRSGRAANSSAHQEGLGGPIQLLDVAMNLGRRYNLQDQAHFQGMNGHKIRDGLRMERNHKKFEAAKVSGFKVS